ncbi:MAG TPA: hypothetical protein VM222_07320 [Planctomycetota bacterium]|nr:hypothetical protein [Planctomycetota bacterium]
MKAASEFKPCDGWTPADFEKHPVRTFDLDSAEEDPEADETWVRPVRFLKRPKDTDCLFLRAELKTSGGETLPGALSVQLDQGRSETQAIALLRPNYLCLDLVGEKLSDRAKQDLAKVKPGGLEWLPIAYKAVLPIGLRRIPFSGQAE